MNELIEDYQRKINSVNELLKDNTNSDETINRLKIKVGCYRSFLTDLKRALNIDLVMLSEIETESDKIANIIDNGISGHSLGESQGFVSGVEFVLNEIKERTHSA